MNKCPKCNGSSQNPQYGIIFLHGGGGKKEPMAFDLGFKSDTEDTSYTLTTEGAQWLADQKVMAVFPQGQTLNGYNAWTWSNYVMNSGQDDVAFLTALVSHLKNLPLATNVTKYYLVGHSNGGMMANRMWCESPNTFDAYAAIAGPASEHLDPSTGSQPCNPSTQKPFLGLVGNRDTVLATSGRMNTAVWTINPLMSVGNPPTWMDTTPKVINEKFFHTVRTNLKCGGSVQSPTTSGNITTYSDCSGTLKLVIIDQQSLNGTATGGDHCLARLSGTCVTTLTAGTDITYRSLIFSFLKDK